MNVQIQDRAALSSLDVVSLRAYLDSMGWRNLGQWGERSATIFAIDSGGRTWEIPVPHNGDVVGFAEGMADAVAVLAAVEERSQLDVFDDLAHARVDSKNTMLSVLDETKYRSELGGIYGVAEAARYLKAALDAEVLYPVTSRTLRGWIRQRCVQADGDEFPVDFDDLIAMRVIATLRSAGVSRSVVNDSEFLMREETGQGHPMSTETLWGGEGQAFSEWRKRLISAGRRGQAAFDLVQEYLIPARDLVFDESSGQTVSWEPRPGIVLNPLIQFGSPCIKATRIPTSAISGMIAAGDSVEWTARAYRISPEEVQASCDWESRLESA